MKNLDSFLGILFIIGIIIGCQVVGEMLGEGLFTGLFFIAMAIVVIATLYRQMTTKSKD